ncbi:MAG: ribosome maturation factor RimM [Candidatus Dasytiphilus stammeri]
MNDLIIKPLILGKMGSAYGVRGWIKLISFTQKKSNIFFYQPWFINKSNSNQSRQIQLEKWYNKNHNFIIKLKGINNREEAKELNNYNIIIESSKLPPLSEGEYYWKDIIGCVVITSDGDRLGKVVHLFSTLSNDIIVVKLNRCKIKEILIPFIENKVIEKIDLKMRIIQIAWKTSIFQLPRESTYNNDNE